MHLTPATLGLCSKLCWSLTLIFENMSAPQWFYDLTEPTKATGTRSTIPVSQIPRLPRPKFFTSTKDSNPKTKSTPAAKINSSHERHLKVKRAWELALGPAKSLPMNLIMSYFSGNGLQIMTISMTLYMFFITPFTQMLNVQQMFEPLESKKIKRDILTAKLVYILSCLSLVAAGVWKFSQMGLLPNHSTDWIAWEKPAQYYY